MAVAFRALADPARVRLLGLIAARADGEICVSSLTRSLALSQATVSHHLKVLSDAGLLDRARRGTWVFYRLVGPRVAAVRDALTLPAAAHGVDGRRVPGVPYHQRVSPTAGVHK